MAKIPPVTPTLVRSLYGPVFGGSDFFTIGDSIEAGGFNGSSYSDRIAQQSDGAYRQRVSYAAGGKRLDQMLTEQVPLAIASGLRRGIGGGSTNDQAQNATDAEIRARLIALLNALRRAGIDYTDCGPLPQSNPG